MPPFVSHRLFWGHVSVVTHVVFWPEPCHPGCQPLACKDDVWSHRQRLIISFQRSALSNPADGTMWWMSRRLWHLCCANIEVLKAGWVKIWLWRWGWFKRLMCHLQLPCLNFKSRLEMVLIKYCSLTLKVKQLYCHYTLCTMKLRGSEWKIQQFWQQDWKETENKYPEALLLLRRWGKGISGLLVLQPIGEVIFYDRL